MGPFRFTCACLLGAFVLASAYQALIWGRDRRHVLSLAAALHAASSGVFAWSLLRLASASTVDEMQVAVDQRALAAIPVLLSVTFQLAAFARLPPARYLLAAASATAVTIVARLLAGTAGGDVIGVEQIVVLGEVLSAPVRVTGLAHWLAGGVVGATALFAVWCGWRMWATDRIGGALVMVTGVLSIATAPFVAVLRPWAMPMQPLTLVPQGLFVLVAAMHVAREHEARARAALSAERLYRAMFDQTYQLVGLLDLQGRVIEASRSTTAATGLEVRDIIGLPYEDVPGWRTSPDRDRLRLAIASATAGATTRQEMTFVAPSGALRVFDVSIRPLRDEAGTVIRLIPEARDVTDERTAQEAHRRIEAQLHQSQKLEAVGQLAGGIAHDFNNLLTVIHGFASLLTTAPDCAARRVELDQIQSASERAMSLTRQLLTFSHHAVPDTRVLDLNELVRRTEPLLQRLVGADIRIRLRMAPDLPPIKADPSQLERVLINLVVNARDAMPGGGTVEIATRLPDRVSDGEVAVPGGGGCAVLTVRDTGTGMSPEVQARLFEPFFTTKAPGRGTGLGLAIVDRVVKQARGLVAVASAPGHGTTFTLYFPVTAEPAVAADATTRAPVAARGHETILVVEDERAVRELAVAVLTQHGYVVLQAGAPGEAIDIGRAHASAIDLLLSDVVMPGGSATTIVDALRPRCPGMRVLFMSGYPADEAVRRGVAAGESNFLQKPFTPGGLAARVRELLDA